VRSPTRGRLVALGPRPGRPENEPELHRNRIRALSFGSEAERYERARPGYPPALIDALVAPRPERVLDVGCGTGKAARLLAQRGCAVLGVEPDARMAEVARGFGVAVEVAPFEVWEPRGRTFDLLVSAQAWHWIDPAVGPKKAASVLGAGARLVLFWNQLQHEAGVVAILQPAYRRFAPELADTSMALGHVDGSAFRGDVAAVVECGLFQDFEMLSFDWALPYTTDGWLDYLATCSDHIGLAPAAREQLLRALGSTIDAGLAGTLPVRYRTHLISARRAGRG
jgi:SAM-dependent methyltransferase